MHHIERQNEFWTKNANNRFLSKISKYSTDVHLCIVKLESGGQQLPVIEKISPEIFLTLKNPLSYLVLKTYVFTQIIEC